MEEEGENEKIIDALNERLEEHDNSRKKVQEMLHGICDKMRKQIDEMEEKVLGDLEEKFTNEDTRLQDALNEFRTYVGTEGAENRNILEAARKARAKLLVAQTYEIKSRPAEGGELSVLYGLSTERRICLEWAEMAKPWDLRVTSIADGKIFIQFGRNIYEEDAFIKNAWETGSASPLVYKALLCKKGENTSEECIVKKEDYDTINFSIAPEFLDQESEYVVRVKGVYGNYKESEWSDPVELRTPKFSELWSWKECPRKGYGNGNYGVYKDNGKTMEFFGATQWATTGNAAIPVNGVSTWNIRIAKSNNNDGKNIFIGVSPISIREMSGHTNYTKCGWFIHCQDSTLYSGPPHNYKYPGKEYGPRMFSGEYVHTGDKVGVVMDTHKGEMSFIINGINYGVAYTAIPLDKPLIPCVVLSIKGDSIEIDSSEVKENTDAQIPVPSNLATRSDFWDSITFSWDPVPGSLFYQVEIDGCLTWMATPSNTITAHELQAGSEHFFRVRAVRGNAVGEWSHAMNGKTQEMTMENGGWKKCPEHIYSGRKYDLDANDPRIAIKRGNYEWCTVIGNTALPPDKVVSWSIKILKSSQNNGAGIYIGVAPTTIDQNENENFNRRGWYFNCSSSTLKSGNYQGRIVYKARKRKEEGEEHVQTGDSIEVVMDMRKGDLSFFVKGKYLSSSFKGIPLDKPLVPCVLLRNEGDSVKLESLKADIDIGSFGKKGETDTDLDKKDCIIS